MSAETRAEDLVRRMTLEEKISQMQDHAAAIPRLGIPDYEWSNEGLHGVARAGYATVFPQAIGLAATWDEKLMFDVATTISTEARAKYAAAQASGNHKMFFGLTFWSPNINIFRDPRWGRGQETFGEDPFLTSQMAVAYVRGMQGGDPTHLKVVSTPKHFAEHSGPEAIRHGFKADASNHDLADTYLPAFRAAVIDGGAASVMCAYNAVRGEPACANPSLLETTLRQSWKFKGYVVSDCGAISDVYDHHKFSEDIEHAAAAALKAGTDLSCGTEFSALLAAVHDGLVEEQQVDQAVTRLMRARILLGMLDSTPQSPWAKTPPSENDTPEHSALALKAANSSMVLLKNAHHTLPISSSVKRIALIGPNAASLSSLVGEYNGDPSHPVTVYAGMRHLFQSRGVHVDYAQGSPYTAGLMLPVPPDAFHRSGARNAASGLHVEYFKGTDFREAPVAQGTVDSIDADWNASAPIAQLGGSKDLFSVRYSGTITVPAPGDYPFRVDLSDAVCTPCEDSELIRAYVDGKKVEDALIAGDSSDDFSSNRFTVHFADAKPHAFVLEYSHASPLFSAGLSLNWDPPASALRAHAVAVARQADMVVAVLGLSPNLEGEEMSVDAPGFSHGDRTDIALPRVQTELLQALRSTGKPLVLVLMNGSAVAVNWAQHNADAILEAWYPGQMGGAAVAQTLAGINNPAGRLPVTFYASTAQLPPFDDYSMKNRTYRYFTEKPLYPFGYGLSYSSFRIGHVHSDASEVQAGQNVLLHGTVENISSLAGDEVIEMYVTSPYSAGTPLRSLAGFQRFHLRAGEKRDFEFALTPREMSLVDEGGKRYVAPGSYSVFVGESQPEMDTRGIKVQVRGSVTLPE